MKKIFLWTNPTNSTVLAMILLLIFVKKMAYAAVIFSKQCATIFTSLLGMLDFFTVDALHFLHLEAVELMVLTVVVTQPASIQLVTTRRLEQTAAVIVLAAPPPSLRAAADAIFPRRRRRHLLHLPSQATEPSPSLEATPPRSRAGPPRLLLLLHHLLLLFLLLLAAAAAAAATTVKMAAAHVIRGSQTSGSCPKRAEAE